jgi:hypothetical protein
MKRVEKFGISLPAEFVRSIDLDRGIESDNEIPRSRYIKIVCLEHLKNRVHVCSDINRF